MGVRVLDISLVGLALYLVARLARRRSAPLPPGPPGWPLIGNLLDLRTHGPYTALGAMSGKYGKCMLTSYMYRSLKLYTRSDHIPQRIGHAMGRSQFLKGIQGPTREEERYHLQQAMLCSGW